MWCCGVVAVVAAEGEWGPWVQGVMVRCGVSYRNVVHGDLVREVLGHVGL
jgi:hypothetical protein